MIAHCLASMSLNKDMTMSGSLNSQRFRGSQECQIVSLFMWTALWIENVCQWNCTSLPVISCLSMNLDESHVSESVVVHV